MLDDFFILAEWAIKHMKTQEPDFSYLDTHREKC